MQGTALVCDAPRTAGALAFLSHAGVVGAHVTRRSPVTAAQVLLTQTTADLLQANGHDLASRALVAAYGRPFVLGLLRVELFPSGVAPGSASLLCESPSGLVVFAGPVGLGVPGGETLPAEIRPAAAVCVDATYAALEAPFLPVAEAIAAAVRFAKTAVAGGRQPVFLVALDSLTLQMARALTAAGLSVRAHAQVAKLAQVYGEAGLAPTVLQRFSGKVAPNDVLLMPTSARLTATLARLKSPALAVTATAAAANPDLAQLRPEGVFPLTNASTRGDLLSYVKATGAKEVATLNDHDGAFAALLRHQGLDAYPLGPPAQMTLFAA